MQLTESELRIKNYGHAILKFCRMLPADREGILIENNLYRAISAMISHFHNAARSRNNDEFINRLIPVSEDLDHIMFWLEYIQKMEIVEGELLTQHIDENNELMKLMISTIQRLSTSRKTSFT